MTSIKKDPNEIRTKLLLFIDKEITQIIQRQKNIKLNHKTSNEIIAEYETCSIDLGTKEYHSPSNKFLVNGLNNDSLFRSDSFIEYNRQLSTGFISEEDEDTIIHKKTIISKNQAFDKEENQASTQNNNNNNNSLFDNENKNKYSKYLKSYCRTLKLKRKTRKSKNIFIQKTKSSEYNCLHSNNNNENVFISRKNGQNKTECRKMNKNMNDLKNDIRDSLDENENSYKSPPTRKNKKFNLDKFFLTKSATDFINKNQTGEKKEIKENCEADDFFCSNKLTFLEIPIKKEKKVKNSFLICTSTKAKNKKKTCQLGFLGIKKEDSKYKPVFN